MKFLILTFILFSSSLVLAQDIQDNKFTHGEKDETSLSGYASLDQGMAKGLHSMGVKGGVLFRDTLGEKFEVRIKSGLGFQTGYGIEKTHLLADIEETIQMSLKKNAIIGLGAVSLNADAFRYKTSALNMFFMKKFEEQGVCVSTAIKPYTILDMKQFEGEFFQQNNTRINGYGFDVVVKKSFLKEAVSILGSFEALKIRNIRTYDSKNDESVDNVPMDNGNLVAISVGAEFDCSKLAQNSDMLENLSLRVAYRDESGRYFNNDVKTNLVVVPEQLQVTLVKKF
ncbi:MAG: hypothetical protein JNM93_05380 [Bacteriovoracaceae bacterium]|nr:hypothetical protein [Bacteriovoracaceae bacterium]